MASEDTAVAQGLECCLCFELFTEPKLLSCAHTFCKKCLERLYESHPKRNQLICPICRKVTSIKTRNINQLQTNILIKSLVENVKSTKRSCTICDPEVKSPAVQYCMQCDEYMCVTCTVHHGKFKKNAKHNVVSVDDVKSGKIRLKRFCNTHPEEEKLYVCTPCNESICFRCRMLDHNDTDHKIEKVADFKKTIQKQIESLQGKATAKIATIESHLGLVNEHKSHVEVKLDHTIAEINQAYNEVVQHITKQRNDLIDRCKQEKEILIAQLEKIKESNYKLMSRIRSASELVGNGIKTLLEGQTMDVHKEISCDLQKMLDESNPKVKEPNSISDRANRLKFVRNASANLGDFSGWLLEEVSTFPLSCQDPHDAVALPDGRVAVGNSREGKIEVFTADGSQETVVEDVEVYNVSVLSDGRYVVLDYYDNITLYTQAGERLDVKVNTPMESDFRGMCVDRNDNIYVGNTNTDEIVVFRPEGGESLTRQIPCNNYALASEICHMNHNKRLVVCDRQRSVSIINDMDGTGTGRLHIEIDSFRTCTAVLKDDSILIACRDDDDQLNVYRYTESLEMIDTVLSDFPMKHDIHKLVELSTGEIVLISKKDFIVFTKSTSA